MDAATADTRGDFRAVALRILEVDEQALAIIRVNSGGQVEGLLALNQGPATTQEDGQLTRVGGE